MQKVVLVDDHILLRQGLEGLINTFEGFVVLFGADDGKDFIAKLNPSNLPDLVLMDITMQEMNGYETTKWIKINYPQINVLALSMMDDEAAVIKMLRYGAKGFVVKNTKPSELLIAMNSVLKHGYYFNELVSTSLISSFNKIENLHVEKKPGVYISERENQFLVLNCSELSYKEIAEKMCISPRTVDGYRDNLYVKLGVKTRVGLAVYAIKSGLVVV